tara:strand:+ start:136 stop:999 length:864 start_codon:yes stop_codon:yes gene_type:complete
MSQLKIIECPRDAMQSIKKFIPTDMKVKYIQSLLDVGFHTVDMGSFVSKKVIPQLSDTADVIKSLDLSNTKTSLLVIVANIRGAEYATNFKEINYIGFPFSVSENFQMRNTNRTIEQSFHDLIVINQLIKSEGKKLIVYLSMCFGNPYGEIWNLNLIDKWIFRLTEAGVGLISLSDTVGSANPDLIEYILTFLLNKYPGIEFGLHLHTHPNNCREKINTSLKSGCLRIDGAIQGFGGCPMASDNLIGNMPTEKIISYCEERNISLGINSLKFESAYNYASHIFQNFY